MLTRIDYRFDSNWTGDPSVFIEVGLAQPNPDREKLFDLFKRFRWDLLMIVGSEDLGMRSYVNFVSKPSYGR